MPRKAEFIFPPKRCEWPILSSLIIHEAFFEVPRCLWLASNPAMQVVYHNRFMFMDEEL